MKCKSFLAGSLLVGAAMLTSCGGGNSILGELASAALTSQLGGNGVVPTATTNNAATNGAGILGSLLGGAVGVDSGTTGLLSGVIGSLIGGIGQASIVGTWVYEGPSVEFESENLLAKAGGAVASNEIVNKLSPYYQTLGIKPGALVMQFNQDNTCIIQANGRTHQANYTYDTKSHKLKITGQMLGLSLGTSYATVSATQMSLTFDSTKLLGVAQGLASNSGSTTLSTISSLSKSFSGMKTGFKFTRK